jgi:hypothetical protein
VPAGRLTASRGKRPRQPVGPQGMVPPIGFHGPSLRRRNEGQPEGMFQHAGRKERGQAALEPRPGPLVSFVSPAGHP